MKKMIEFINSIKKEYDRTQFPFLQKQLERVVKNQPYKGIKILHNIPFTRETIIKLEILYAGGAEIVVTSPSFMDVDIKLLEQFVEAGGHWQKEIEVENNEYDIYLDCAGELLDIGKPKIGTVEITGTGTNKYSKAKTAYPVISVDQSKIKNLEGVLGTGEAFVRAFKELAQEDIKDREFMIFGYGKVGKGIAQYLEKYTSKITIIDVDKEHLNTARKRGFATLIATNTKEIEKRASSMFAIVTATGIKDVVSKNYDVNFFKDKYLANMGGEDEFGYAFEETAVMCKKKPINFFIDKPTLMRYLDPVFYAHNMGVDILMYSNLENGLHPFPAYISDEVVATWETIFNEMQEVV